MDKKSIHNEHYSNFVFKDYSIEEIKLELNDRFLYDRPVEIKFSIENNVVIRDGAIEKDSSPEESQKLAVVTVDCHVFEDAQKNNYPFTLNIRMVGEFSFIGKIGDDDFRKFCEMNGVATLLPYLRTSITNITAIANIQPLVLPLLNIYNLHE